MSGEKPAFVALTEAGLSTGARAKAALGGEVDRLTSEHVRSLFESGRPIVGICAAGILIRILAPLLSDKRDEPPVIAVSEDGASVVPLLGGHRGANELARKLAGTLGGHAAITTAGDNRFGVALDAPPSGWSLANPHDAKSVMAALLGGATARLEGEAAWLSESRIPFAADGAIRLVATTRAIEGDATTLVYHPRRLVVGLGSERDAAPAEAIDLVRRSLAESGLAEAAIAAVASLDLKADEPAVLNVAETLGVPARFFTADALEAETPRLKNPSETVFREVGCHGVAEGAALAATGPQGKLVVTKLKSARVTCAIAEAPDMVDPTSVGRLRGKLAIVGIGPGAEEWLAPEARRLLGECDAVVGYSLYLDLVAPLVAHAERFESALGAEEARVRKAIALAAEGRSVSLVSSGDAGIYALATLVFEVLDQGSRENTTSLLLSAEAVPPPSLTGEGDHAKHGGGGAHRRSVRHSPPPPPSAVPLPRFAGEELPDAARRIEIVVAPGISAMQAAAARAGAPLGHDLCAISLSDLLTPWETIEARIRAAAEGDFVIAFYNPVSARRRTQLADAKAILLEHRPRQTPVVLARNLGRAEESVTTTTLAALDVDQVDMLTLVLVGSSTTRQVAAGGRIWTYTPRGYEKKLGDGERDPSSVVRQSRTTPSPTRGEGSSR